MGSVRSPLGRQTYTESLVLEGVGVKVDARGRIEVNTHYKTNVQGVYAIGDVIAHPTLPEAVKEAALAVLRRAIHA